MSFEVSFRNRGVSIVQACAEFRLCLLPGIRAHFEANVAGLDGSPAENAKARFGSLDLYFWSR